MLLSKGSCFYNLGLLVVFKTFATVGRAGASPAPTGITSNYSYNIVELFLYRIEIKLPDENMVLM
ncbi:hypothetical protein DVR12_05940 [Chitinophaga silvatica]|uniref:Uncharacterized protein n=1 Tax=Chitinophaga silvatica TaxID=2282649 RepID=A0A3E1YDX7_9BACT|nr:hypothetical protein DVR12_05940 [Chitinophaga silvatica]